METNSDSTISITKKEFKEYADHHLYSGFKNRINAFFFGWKQDFDKGIMGFKFGVAANTQNCTKKELVDILYNWVTKAEQPPYYVRYKFAETDQKRFKVPITLNF